MRYGTLAGRPQDHWIPLGEHRLHATVDNFNGFQYSILDSTQVMAHPNWLGVVVHIEDEDHRMSREEAEQLLLGQGVWSDEA
jgi:hypothetical protein